jgi:hypothetical protein
VILAIVSRPSLCAWPRSSSARLREMMALSRLSLRSQRPRRTGIMQQEENAFPPAIPLRATAIPPKARVRQPGPQRSLQANGSYQPMTADWAEFVPDGSSQSRNVTLRPSLQSRDHDHGRCRRRRLASTASTSSFPLEPLIRRCPFCRALPIPSGTARDAIQVGETMMVFVCR